MINVFGSCVGKEEIDEIADSISKQWLGFGKKCEKMESIFTERLGQDFILVDNCSNGLELSVKLLELPKGSEVIVPAVTWVSCATAVVKNQCIPVFADCDYHTLNITKDTVENVITDKTKAIMVVHYSGYPVDVDSLKSFGLPIIEDAAHAVDSAVGGKWCGTLGAVGVYSFDSMKNIACGELGGLTSPDPYIMDMARKSRYCGLTKSGLQNATSKDRWWEYDLNGYCSKQLPSDIMACIGLAQYKKLDMLQKRRKDQWEFYQEEFGAYPIPSNYRHSYFTFFIRSKKRDKLARYLLDNGVYTTLRYQPLHLLFKEFYRKELPISEEFNETGLNLPLHPCLGIDDQWKIINLIREFENAS